MTYCTRLKHEGGRRAGEDVAETLERAPLTPRERDVVSLLVSGSSTRDIASRTGLTVSTVNRVVTFVLVRVVNPAAAFSGVRHCSSDSVR